MLPPAGGRELAREARLRVVEGLACRFYVWPPSDRFAASSPQRGEPDMVKELTAQTASWR